MTAPAAVIIDAEGPRLTRAEMRAFSQLNPWGFILFARNIETPDQTRALCDELRDAVGRDALITIDQEGGRVQRLRAPHWYEFNPPLQDAVAAGTNAPRAFALRYQIIAAELRDLGIDSTCAPTCDIARDTTHPFLANRCLGQSADQVIANARASIDALLNAGVLPVMKHMPGHGLAQVDSHYGLPCVDAPVCDLMAQDFAPFRALDDCPIGMTAHIVFDQIDPVPATLSPKMVSVIRQDIGFNGLLTTDDLSMKALSGTAAEKTAAARAAGCDIAMYCNADLDTRIAVCEAAGPLGGASLERAQSALSLRDRPRQSLDIRALHTQLETLLTGDEHGRSGPKSV